MKVSLANRIKGALRGWSVGSADLARHLGVGYRSPLSGVSVTDDTALEATSYFAGVRNVSEDLASLPLITYRRISEERRERDQLHYLYSILHDQPNEEIDSVTFVEAMQAHLMMRRNAYAEIVRDGAGRCAALWPVHPKRVSMRRVDGELFYQVDLPEGRKDTRTGYPWTTLDRSRVLHLRALALDGLEGLSTIKQHRETIGLTLAVERYGAAFFGNDATPGGVYEVPGRLSDEAYKRMKAEIEGAHRGIDKAHRLRLLEEGTKYSATSTQNDKAQFIETRQLQTEEMARINRVPPHTIQDLSHSTNNNIEHQGIEYVQYSIRVWAVRWEKAIYMQVMLSEDRKTHYAEFLLDALLRGDSVSQATVLHQMRQDGAINADEWRRLKNMNPIEDGSGQIYMVNGNMIPMLQAGNPKAPKTEPPADPVRFFEPLALSMAERCLRKEAAAVSKAAKKYAYDLKRLDSWTLEFYEEQQRTMRDVWSPLYEALARAGGATMDGARQWAAKHAQRRAEARSRIAVRELSDAVTKPEIAASIAAVTERWAKEEPPAMAEREISDAVAEWSAS